MKFICFLMVSGLLTSCSLSPNNDTKYSNNIRIIKEVPTQNTYSRTYNTKIEQVGYNSSIIKPELEQNNKEKKHNTNTYGNKVKHRVTNKLKNTTDNILDTTRKEPNMTTLSIGKELDLTSFNNLEKS